MTLVAITFSGGIEIILFRFAIYLRNAIFPELSNKICTIKVKILIFVSSIKRTKNENSKLQQATEPIDNHGGNMYALVSCNGIRLFL